MNTTYASVSQNDDAPRSANETTGLAGAVPMTSPYVSGTRTVTTADDGGIDFDLESALDATDVLGPEPVVGMANGHGRRRRRTLAGRPCSRRCVASCGHRQSRQVLPLLVLQLLAIPPIGAFWLFITAAQRAVVDADDTWTLAQILGTAVLGLVYGAVFVLVVGLPLVELVVGMYALGAVANGDDEDEPVLDDRAGRHTTVDVHIWLLNFLRCHGVTES